MECSVCKSKKQIAIKRCKHFELGGEKKTKVILLSCFNNSILFINSSLILECNTIFLNRLQKKK